MFTTLTLINKRSQKRFLSEENVYKNYTFFTTRLFSKKSNNKKRLRKFESRAGMPVVCEQSEIVCRYKFITLVNSVTVDTGFKKIGISDKSGELFFILPFLSEKCGVISIFTESPDAYSDICDEIYRDFGTPTIILNTKKDILGSDIVFSADGEITGALCPVFTAENTKNTTIDLPFSYPDYCNPFIIAAGLFYYGGFHEFGKLKLKQKEGV